MREFKVGDKVRVLAKSIWGPRIDERHFKNRIGYIIDIRGDGSGQDDDNCLVVNGDFNAPEDLELVLQKAPEQKEFIVHCPTRELLNRVQEKMLETNESFSEINWNIYKEKTCLCIFKSSNFRIDWCNKSWFENEYPNTPIISAEEYLGGNVIIASNIVTGTITSCRNQFNPTQVNKPNNKSMLKCALDVVKKLRLTADEKLLIEYGCIDENKNWISQGKEAIGELEVNERGFKSMDEMILKYGVERARGSIFEFDTHLKKHLPKLIENLKKDKAELKK